MKKAIVLSLMFVMGVMMSGPVKAGAKYVGDRYFSAETFEEMTKIEAAKRLLTESNARVLKCYEVVVNGKLNITKKKQ